MVKNKKIQQALLIPLLLLTVGLGLQSFLGAFPIEVWAYPYNLIAALILLLVVVGLSLFLPKHPLVRFLSSGAAALSALFFISLFSLLLGFTHQSTGGAADIPSRLGIRAMTSYYPFVLAYLYLMTTLSFATISRLKRKGGVNNVGFFLNHTGLLLVLFALGFGAADELSLRAKVHEGGVVDRAWTESGEVHELDFQLQLLDFQVSNYPAKLAIIHLQTRKYLPERAPDFYDIDTMDSSFSLLGETYELLTYINQASPTAQGGFSAKTDEGLPPAVLVRDERGKSAWICCGKELVPYRLMHLPNNQALVMLAPEVETYTSLVRVKQGDEQFEQEILVNKPLHLGAWSVYQSGFDDKQGAASSFSIFQLTYDPWRPLVQLGFAMLALGALGLLCFVRSQY